MIRHLGSALTDMTYVFDEPTTGCTRTTSSA
jgi:excinuclease UvrABC ATPase subunit